MLEPGQLPQKIADKRWMIEKDAVFVEPDQAVGVDGFCELIEGENVVCPETIQGDGDLEQGCHHSHRDDGTPAKSRRIFCATAVEDGARLCRARRHAAKV